MTREHDFSRAKRGAVIADSLGKTRITIRIDDDVLAHYRAAVNEAGGGNYQTLINAALRRAMTESIEPLEAIMRRVIRDELGTRPANSPTARRRKSTA